MNKLLFHDVPHRRTSLALLALRLVVGTAFVIHGSGKITNPFGWMGDGAPVPGVLQSLAAISEFGGGLAWIVGLLTPLAGLGILCTMAVAMSTHMMRGDGFVGGYELALAYFAVALVMILAGPGRYSLDALIFRPRATDNAATVDRTAYRRA